ncbi:MAG: 50S ribosomal protein L7Ae-like protein [Sulfobacillus thermosulfidooxidans]|uniref:50S ribosomal protein L7Ae/L30e/S12e/Gadd45 n=1 Tax=Sulfobacillus thermotolerans TaxID=338644 RepID=A0ABN5GZZ4_9FIRM|nr:ribosomal L7Ae/L30e/S12e/Gadd45 family protein [Sulfobacillus sp. hq2]AUW92933.1 50S ribosomal protein L7Ae/L30e/S12e/Gadd45 [Sulfobacillus thermotolerans]MCY0907144.1 ribosomal L7Ae/L30e/S12e/Gadd45 family protein [Sulfobacillus thermotolerans]POB11204.1 50S ribosomal protein L7Ae-like protein [Sulfobacillus sp. hq2]PSR35128.1 MAG: 50S ribosomal protein L7Ae-like protein [Sulfobacillus thermosulfidooxidans]
MDIDALRDNRRRVVGMRETLKKITHGTALHVYIAKDAEARVIEDIATQSQNRSIPIDYVDSMDELGRLCGIEVGAACAALIPERA